MTTEYECDKCGACCRHLLVEIGWIDVQREPKLREVAEPFSVPPECFLEDEDGERIVDPDPYMAGAMLACAKPCPMLADNSCSIYPTRPGCCVGMEAGGRQCQEARQAAGLEPLPFKRLEGASESLFLWKARFPCP